MLAAQPDYGKQLTDLSTALQRIASAPDYTEQLNDISSALNRPTTPQWVFILGGAVLGAAFALLVQLLVRYVDAHAKRATMRKIVYREIIANYQRVHELMRDPALLLTSFADQWKAEIENLKTSVTYHGEEYCKGHLDTFAELPESASIDYAYAKFHQILSDNTSLRVNMRQAASAVLTYLAKTR